MKYLLLILACFSVWQCCSAMGSYEVVEKKAEVTKFDSLFVESAYFNMGRYDLNSNGITEKYFEEISIYLDSLNYGKKWPKKIEGIVYSGLTKAKIESPSVEILNTISGVGIFVKKRFYGDETCLKLILTLDEEPPRELVLEFELEQKSYKAYHSRCMDSFYRL